MKINDGIKASEKYRVGDIIPLKGTKFNGLITKIELDGFLHLQPLSKAGNRVNGYGIIIVNAVHI